ncbi:30S ribosome-binding factor RbfA [Saccharophagus sp. K07]|jgi:ribosome-binding factor A|uniref:30S ribosome-binding factor RbfA n=1 Tax=Saccharophagus sp. K07 TaxID=2283636 RepID=UPI00165261F9|nr:30S ribosome-binding factor RbfA [Saccharophagus sp. K07]MBC6905738.1 30S ribosome-binding factor RbfA [Saccharophagus sp. K07]
MAREFSRSDRVADAVQRSLAHLIPAEIRDPRLGMVNINSVEVSRDLTLAKIYVTFVGEDNPKACQDSVSILNNAASFLRSLVGKELTVRSTPRLQFYYDESSVRGQVLSNLIDRAIAADKANKRDSSSEEDEQEI